jgi:hypothetical protein
MSHVKLLKQGKVSYGEYAHLERLKAAGQTPEYHALEKVYAKRPRNYVFANSPVLGIRKRRAFGTRKDGRRYPKPGYVHDSTRVKKLVRAVAEYARVTPEQVVALAKIRGGPNGGHVLAVFKMPGSFIDVRTEVDGKVYRSVIDKKGRFAAVTAEMGHAGLTKDEEDREEAGFQNYQMTNQEGKRIDDYEAKK